MCQHTNGHFTAYVVRLIQISFLRRYHPGIDVPSRLLTSAIMDDAQAQIAQEDDGSDLVKCTTTVLPAEEKRLVVCVGGVHRNELCMSPFSHRHIRAGWAARLCIGKKRPAYQFTHCTSDSLVG